MTATAVAAMFLAAWAGCLFITNMRGAVLVGLSMIPRAEIAMIIVLKGRSLGDWAMPPGVFGGMVLVSLVTCLSVPIVLKRLFADTPRAAFSGGE